MAGTAAQAATPFETQSLFYQEMALKSVRDISLLSGPSYQETRERKLWGEDSSLRHDWYVTAPSTGDRLDLGVEMYLSQRLRYRYPLSKNSALYGENYTETRWYGNSRYLSSVNPDDRLGAESKTVLGFEQRFGTHLRLRVPLLWQTRYYSRVALPSDRRFRHDIWLAPQLAIQTGAQSELVFTISTDSLADSAMQYWKPANLLKTYWHQVSFRTAL